MSDIDVQLHPKGVAIIPPDEVWDENLPGQLNLTNDEADELRDMLNEAWLNRHGMQPLSIPAGEVEKGDVIPSIGLTVLFVSQNYPSEDVVLINLSRGASKLMRLQVPANLEITVHRRIQ